MKFPKLVAAALLCAAVPSVGYAEEAPQIAEGAAVYGPEGNPVGVIEQVSGDTVVVKTDKHSATLQRSAFGTSDKGLSITFTQAQLNEAIEAANQAVDEKLTAALVPGAAVRSSDGVALGAVQTVSAEGPVTVDREGGAFTLARENFAIGESGLIIHLTAAQLDEAIAQAQSAEPAGEQAH